MASLLVSRAASRVLTPPTYSPLLISRAATRSRSLITLSGGGGGDPRLAGLRSAMAAAGVDAFVVPSGDPHLSEYVHPCYERRGFISGFTGSAGTALITADAALLWTDGRYFLQAEQELGAEWTLMRSGNDGVPKLETWAAENLPAGSVVGIDPYVHSVDEASALQGALTGAKKDLSMKALYGGENLVDGVWAEAGGRPEPPSGLARSLPLDVAGKTCSEKLSAIGEACRKHGAGAYLVGALDEVAWLLNVRGSDVPMCPVLQSYVLVHCPTDDAKVTATLFVEKSKLTPELETTLTAAGVGVAAYADVEAAVNSTAAAGTKILLDPKVLNYGLRQLAGESAILETSPIATPKAMKNEAELNGMIEAHLTDGASLARFFAWIERTVMQEGTPITEVEAANRLEGFRSEGDGFLELSFPTICGNGPNGAIIHYNPLVADPSMVGTIDGNSMVLLDSGAQYAVGTTDVTRTFHLGTPTQWEREAYTRVLKGNIALDSMVFPDNTPGMAIDAFARTSLWQAGLDYLHGTGHGVGAALNVHEGPISISARYQNTCGLRAGMVLSNEPGYYETGGFGVRIENLLIVEERPELTWEKTPGGKKFLGFTQLTHVPIQKKCIDASMLTSAEIGWIDAYHQRVWERVSPRLEEGSEGYVWLREATTPIEVPAAVPVGAAAAA